MAFDRDSIIRKLKKMRAKATSAEKIGSEDEAASFAEAIQRMLTQHKIEMTELGAADQEEIDPIDRIRPDYASHKIKVRARRVDWMEDLARVVADAHYCRMLILPGSSVLIFCGKRSDAQVAADVFVKLLEVAETLAAKEYVSYFYECRDKGDVTQARGFRTSFLKGFCRRIGDRYFEYREALKAYYAHDQKALAIINDGTRVVDEFIELNIKKRAPAISRSGRANREGFHRGTDKANQVELTSHKKVGG